MDDPMGMRSQKGQDQMRNESEWLDELHFIRSRTQDHRTSYWVGYVNEQARKCQFPQIAQAMLDCLEREDD